MHPVKQISFVLIIPETEERVKGTKVAGFSETENQKKKQPFLQIADYYRPFGAYPIPQNRRGKQRGAAANVQKQEEATPTGVRLLHI